MRIHFLQNASFEKPGYLETLIRENGYFSTYTPLFRSTEMPDLHTFDLLIILGGPMNVYQEKDFPYLNEEKKFIEKSINAGKKVLGICLGAQLIATVLGASVTTNPVKEIGWFPVRLSDDYSKHWLLKNLPAEFVPMHWHGDTFQIPSGAQRIASSEACQNQGFIYNERVMGLQFHLETSLESLDEMVKNCHGELIEGNFIQKKADLLNGAGQFMSSANKIMEHLFRALCSI